MRVGSSEFRKADGLTAKVRRTAENGTAGVAPGSGWPAGAVVVGVVGDVPFTRPRGPGPAVVVVGSVVDDEDVVVVRRP